MTDNRTRTVADVRHAFSKYGGNLGTDGSVAFLFKHCGQIVFAPGTDENKVMEAAIDAGADDVVTNDDGSIEVVTGPYDFVAVKDALAKAGLKPEFAEVTMKPLDRGRADGDDAREDAEAPRRARSRSTTCRRSTRPRCSTSDALPTPARDAAPLAPDPRHRSRACASPASASSRSRGNALVYVDVRLHPRERRRACRCASA